MNEADSELEQIEIDLLLHGIARRYGYDFRHYVRPSLRRRVLRAVEREELPSVSALQARVLHDPECMARFVANLSVNVTAMFRDPGFHRCLRQRVVPILRAQPFIRIWHAGCASGEEVYSLAIMLHEEGLYDRCRLYATDISDVLLEQAAQGVFPLHTMRENTENYQRAGGLCEFSSYYRAGEKRAIFRRFLRENIVVSHHNLVSDAPFNEFDLVLCRNVMIYFDASLRRRVHQLLYDSLAQQGILGLGSRETLEDGAMRESYAEFAPEYRLYRKGP
jgi:chemotaxis protein methyltransferase CheR